MSGIGVCYVSEIDPNVVRERFFSFGAILIVK